MSRARCAGFFLFHPRKRKVIEMTKTRSTRFYKILKPVTLALLSAIGLVLMAIVRFPLFPSAAFLEYDMADVPVFLATLFFDIPSGLLVLAVISIIQGITVSAGSGWIGIVMHIVATGAFVVALGWITKNHQDFRHLLPGHIAGTLVMAVLMCGMNLLFTPIFMGTPVEAVKDMLLPIILPFNLLKGGINSVVSLVLYFPLVKILHKENLLPQRQSEPKEAAHQAS